MNKQTKGFTMIEIVVAVVVLAIIGGGVYLYATRNTAKTADSTMSDSDMAKMSPTPTADPMAGWKTYTNTTYHYSIKYPADLAYKDFSKSQDGSMIGINTSDALSINTEPFGVIVSVTSGIKTPILDREYYGITIPNSEVKTVTVGGVSGEEWTTSDGPFTEVAVGKDDMTYTVTDSGNPSPKVSDFNLMVSSIEFSK